MAILGGRVIIDKNELNNNRLIVNSPSSNVFLKNSHFIINCIDEPLFNHPSYCVFTSIEGNILLKIQNQKNGCF